MIRLKNVTNENDFHVMCNIESTICKINRLKSWQVHPGGLGFDRYMFGNGANDVFSYGKLVYHDETPVGYVLAYVDEGEYILRIVPDFDNLTDDIIKEAEMLFQDSKEYFVISNSANENLCKALMRNGYKKEEQVRFQAALDLDKHVPAKKEWISERIAALTEEDLPERAQYTSLSTGYAVSEEMYRDFFSSDSYKNTLDYVIRDKNTNDFIGYATWWVDENSSTALLEPVACRNEYRQRGIMKRALNFGLDQLQKRGIRTVYVGTSIDNNASQALYQSIGFVKTGESNRYLKQRA